MLLVHAHPDDETINNGATMAHYVDQGVHVTLVTCTAGEEGEVLVPSLEHLAAEADDDLGPHRVTELASAMAALFSTLSYSPFIPFPLNSNLSKQNIHRVKAPHTRNSSSIPYS